MELSVRPALTTAPVVRGLDTDHDLRRGQRCTVLNRPVSLINRGKPVQINRATSQYGMDWQDTLIFTALAQNRLTRSAVLAHHRLTFFSLTKVRLGTINEF
jgi:hypothetical protein